MKDNPICLQAPWKLSDPINWNVSVTGDEDKARKDLLAWKHGKTGFPWIDAIMIQLRKEGWIHHLARHSVACFLTRGDLYIR